MKQGFVSDFNALSLLASKKMITYSRPKQLSISIPYTRLNCIKTTHYKLYAVVFLVRIVEIFSQDNQNFHTHILSYT